MKLPDGWSPRTLAGVRTKLLNWFDKHQRDLPWRRTVNGARDAYQVWVSEVMLQQTTVAAVVPYFERFLAAFPDVRALAAADEQRVLKLWEGLGYYRRARHLHAAAKLLVEAHNGDLPDDPDVWEPLPGVGRYILGAVLSQAFDRPLPIVEANSLRVLARLFAYPGDPREGEGKVWVWAAAETVLPAKRAGDFNQSLMELGALVCTPTAPACDRCPVRDNCEAKRLGRQDQIPPKKKQPAITEVAEVGVVIRDGANVLLCQRPANAGRWQNMWEIPHAPRTEGEDVSAAAVRVARELTGFDVEPGAEIRTVRHGVTRYAITLVCVGSVLRGGAFAAGHYANAKWVAPQELGDYPVSSPQRKLMTALADPNHQPRLF
ncbi:putative A/G-specific adenine glycosylase YfhQ [Gemmata obscuriglobus]|uniref:A/G-specific adenine glycosylase n=1 Tax=Gemmata obscuriglobus TaxID=114 RepID=UPI00016C4021|nr:A/G-specific adenine glycosylase [Gemmata obscuriglobus]QEG25997.1 putative A/G-specific adenine glycosylase YfhQ [Gemmata obscuriglobus]VTS00272.1 a g-specific adenine glycosylase : A/G-specific adenine glycosylase OS=Blastopirellula marina DSM 3645 GN=DSM3645_11537 PE=4 SV=1: HhH-GPD: NUDIX_4 [Gemmata obscuriglobus UQM 2246]